MRNYCTESSIKDRDTYNCNFIRYFPVYLVLSNQCLNLAWFEGMPTKSEYVLIVKKLSSYSSDLKQVIKNIILYFNNPPVSRTVDEYIKWPVLVIVMWFNVVFQ